MSQRSVAAGRNVLIIDDSRTIRQFIAKTLLEQRLFERCLQANDGWEGLRMAAAEAVDLILCDLDMPDLDGFGFLERFRAQAENALIPVLMLSGTGAWDKKVEGFARGANDYIVKPCNSEELCARVRNYLRLKLLQDELEQKNRQLVLKNQELAEMAITDMLTGLNNRRYFMERAQQELSRAARHGHDCGVLISDIDHFKRINDDFGHQRGDAAIVAVAQCLKRTLRSTDVVARFGGEEFVGILPETPLEGCAIVAERIRANVASCEIAGISRPISISIGLTVHQGPLPSTVDELLGRADQALYQAKHNGRNRVEIGTGTGTRTETGSVIEEAPRA